MSRHVMINPLDIGKKWLMLYSAISENAARSICAAHSDDGIIWSRLYNEPVLEAGHAGAWDDGGVETPQLVINESKLYLYYYGITAPKNPNSVSSGVGLAINGSGDLRGFERVAA